MRAVAGHVLAEGELAAAERGDHQPGDEHLARRRSRARRPRRSSDDPEQDDELGEREAAPRRPGPLAGVARPGGPRARGRSARAAARSRRAASRSARVVDSPRLRLRLPIQVANGQPELMTTRHQLISMPRSSSAGGRASAAAGLADVLRGRRGATCGAPARASSPRSGAGSAPRPGAVARARGARRRAAGEVVAQLLELGEREQARPPPRAATAGARQPVRGQVEQKTCASSPSSRATWSSSVRRAARSSGTRPRGRTDLRLSANTACRRLSGTSVKCKASRPRSRAPPPR